MRGYDFPSITGGTLLARGAAQRRAKRRREARETLSRALEIFDAIGAALWAERARAELKRISGRAASPGALTRPRSASRPSLSRARRTKRSPRRSTWPTARSKDTLRTSSGSSASAIEPRSQARFKHGGSSSQTRGTLPFPQSLPLRSLGSGGYEGHSEQRRSRDDPDDLTHHRHCRNRHCCWPSRRSATTGPPTSAAKRSYASTPTAPIAPPRSVKTGSRACSTRARSPRRRSATRNSRQRRPRSSRPSPRRLRVGPRPPAGRPRLRHRRPADDRISIAVRFTRVHRLAH